ncbi:GNAT family N-acetyltransferase [Subtercola sp. Z020]|uniref:GNAT family N-acetyltransferase n=1 Tax=Subtercola sp. Z020 TaxID=2080582 RepID=UPI000CE911FB|nr:GNAT family N-acetyltransferase [Subtercola sp. Z020]PPF79767.1 GNAT family N-acetyltransferase [Subtercola sp. Z020]
MIIVRRTVEADWRQVRALRLEMLSDTPLAFGETLASAERLGEAVWRERARRGENPRGTALVAIDDGAPSSGEGDDDGAGATGGGRWVGTMGGYLDPVGPMLVGVYVSPAWRGRAAGVTDLLLDGVEQWARTEADELYLHVHTANPRAIAAYERRGYEATGTLFPYILNPHQQEQEMKKRL